MAMITIAAAAKRLGTSQQTIEEWVRLGILNVAIPGSSSPPESATTLVDEEELDEISECEGWLRLASESLDDED